MSPTSHTPVEIERPSYYQIPGYEIDCNDIARVMNDLHGWGKDEGDILKYLIRYTRKPSADPLDDMRKIGAIVRAHNAWHEGRNSNNQDPTAPAKEG